MFELQVKAEAARMRRILFEMALRELRDAIKLLYPKLPMCFGHVDKD